MRNTIEYLTILACYLPPDWGKAYYETIACEFPYDRWDLHYFPVKGLASGTVHGLRERELSSYAHRIIWDPSKEDLLISCLDDGFSESFKIESDKYAYRVGLQKTLFARVKHHLRSGLLLPLKEKDDTDWVRDYVRYRADRQAAGDFSPYGSGAGILIHMASSTQPDSSLPASVGGARLAGKDLGDSIDE